LKKPSFLLSGTDNFLFIWQSECKVSDGDPLFQEDLLIICSDRQQRVTRQLAVQICDRGNYFQAVNLHQREGIVKELSAVGLEVHNALIFQEIPVKVKKDRSGQPLLLSFSFWLRVRKGEPDLIYLAGGKE
jgi:hypothetical protein